MDLPTRTVFIADIREFDQNCWFDDERLPTCRHVADHVKRILDADLSRPIILSADGMLMDGSHRVAKAYLEGRTEMLAVQFVMVRNRTGWNPARKSRTAGE